MMSGNYINRYAVLNTIDDAIAHNALSYEGCVNEIMEFIAKLPAADVVPVARGKWIVEQTDDLLLEPLGVKDAFRCSSCGYSHINFNQKKHNYCPNCGARMEES